jgi:hypothetical protein
LSDKPCKIVQAFKDLPIHSANVIDFQIEDQYEEDEINVWDRS